MPSAGGERLRRFGDDPDEAAKGSGKSRSIRRQLQPGWRDEAGQLLTEREGASIHGDFGIPARANIEFEVSWKKKPDFVFALGTSDQPGIGQARVSVRGVGRRLDRAARA